MLLGASAGLLWQLPSGTTCAPPSFTVQGLNLSDPTRPGGLAIVSKAGGIVLPGSNLDRDCHCAMLCLLALQTESTPDPGSGQLPVACSGQPTRLQSVCVCARQTMPDLPCFAVAIGRTTEQTPNIRGHQTTDCPAPAFFHCSPVGLGSRIQASVQNELLGIWFLRRCNVNAMRPAGLGSVCLGSVDSVWDGGLLSVPYGRPHMP